MSSYIKPLYMAWLHAFKRTFTVKYPYEVLKPADRYRGRIELNMDRCIGCGVCSYVCPNKAITLVEHEGRKYPQFDYGRCCFCGFCVDHCPRAALKHTHEYELASYNKEDLVFSPSKAAEPPKPFERRVVTVRKLDSKLGPGHG